jgi:hypothetical protein
VSGLPDEAREPAEEVIHYLAHLGLLIDSRLVEAKTVNRYMGGSVLRCWEELAPFVREERRQRGDDGYGSYLERLVGKMNRRRALDSGD